MKYYCLGIKGAGMATLANILYDLGNDVEGYDDVRMIAPWSCDATLREDKEGEMLDSKEVLKNTPRHNGNYIEVHVVIGD